jgi:hypothetical protein
MKRIEKDDVLKAAPEAWPLPGEVAGVKLPDSKLARDATDYVRRLSAPVVFNHVLRTYLFGELLPVQLELRSPFKYLTLATTALSSSPYSGCR